MSSLQHADAIVVGGGPSGLSAATKLALDGGRVHLFEVGVQLRQRRFETLQPRLKTLLAAIGAENSIDAAGGILSPGTVSCGFGARSREWDSILDVNGPAFHVERGAFRAALCKVARSAGVVVHVGVRARPIAVDGGWRVASSTPMVTAPFLIVATGRDALPVNSNVSRQRVDRLVAVLGRVKPTAGELDDRLYLETTPNGWWYDCPAEENRRQLVFLTDADLLRAIAAGPNWFSEQCGRRHSKSSPFVVSNCSVAANTYYRNAVVGDRIILIGDAAMAGDPLAGDGVTWAIASGLQAAKVVASGVGSSRLLHDYSRGVAERVAAFVRARTENYSRAATCQNGEFWARRQAAD